MPRGKVGLGDIQSVLGKPPSSSNTGASGARADSTTTEESSPSHKEQNETRGNSLTGKNARAAKSMSTLTDQKEHRLSRKSPTAASASFSQKNQQQSRAVRIQEPDGDNAAAANKQKSSSLTPKSGNGSQVQGPHNHRVHRNRGPQPQHQPMTTKNSGAKDSGHGGAFTNGNLEEELWQEELDEPSSQQSHDGKPFEYAHPEKNTSKSGEKASFVNWKAHARSVSPMKSHKELMANSPVPSDNSSEIPDAKPVRINTSSTQHPPHASKQRRMVNYKPKTMQEYRQQQLKYNSPDGNTPWQQLGSLGADLENEEVRQKREKTNRMQEYGKTLSNENQKKINKSGRRPPPKEEEAQIREQRRNELAKFRERATEFAQQLPKPKVKSSSKSDQSTASRASSKKSKSTQDLDNELENLLQTHDKLRKEVNSFRDAVLNDDQDY